MVINRESQSKKVNDTKKRTKEAFMVLSAQKKIDKISIKELTDLAGINRSTFYAHFDDIYDLKDQVVADFVKVLEEDIIPIIIDITYGTNFTHSSYNILDIYNQNRDLFSAFLITNRDESLIDSLKEIASASLLERFANMGITAPTHIGYILEYLVSGQLAILAKWVREDCVLSAEDLVSLIKRLNFDGPVQCLFDN